MQIPDPRHGVLDYGHNNKRPRPNWGRGPIISSPADFPTHPANHFGLVSMNTRLGRLADRFAEIFPGESLGYNDMSLVWGGLFDLYGSRSCPECTAWKPPHFEHREGRNTDVDKPALVSRQRRLRALAHRFHFSILEEATHYHLAILFPGSK